MSPADPTPMRRPLRIVLLGLSITSSWGNGHATTYRSLMRGLVRRGHDVLFLERDVSWYRGHRDLPQPPYGRTALYRGLDELSVRWGGALREADLVVVGSYVPDGQAVCRLVQRLAGGATAFYDIDTPVTLDGLEQGSCAYLSPEQIPGFDLYLSFTGGPVLDRLQRHWGARAPRPLYCSVDPELYRPIESDAAPTWDLGYLGTWSADRQPLVEQLLSAPARRLHRRRFVVAGAQYPDSIVWPRNVEHVEHLPPDRHAGFYGAQRFTLNLTRAAMVRLGWSPSVRLFEAAACGVPIISDWWDGLDQFFVPGREILIAGSARGVVRHLCDVPEARRRAIGLAARERVLREHTADHRAAELETHAREALARQPVRRALTA